MRLVPDSGAHYEFQRDRRIRAEDIAKSDIYVLSDDDILPKAHEAIVQAEDCMRRHPQFGMLAFNHDGAILCPAGDGYRDGEVVETLNCGGLRLIRRGCIKQWPIQTRRWYDAEHCYAM